MIRVKNHHMPATMRVEMALQWRYVLRPGHW